MVTLNPSTARVIFSSETFASVSKTRLKSGCENPNGIARKPLAGEGENYCAVFAKVTGGSGRITIKNGRCQEESCSHHERF